MKRTVAAIALLTAAAIAPATLAATDTLQIRSPFLLNGVTIAPGEYKVAVSPSFDTVELTRGKDVVVTAPCKVGPVDQTVSRDEIHSHKAASGQEEIFRLVLARSRMSVEILPAANMASGTDAHGTETR
jgi:hypothetical protein